MALEELVGEVRRGRPRAIARAITLAEDGGPAARDLLKTLFTGRGEAAVLGITGSPGTGKSTLVDQLIGRLRTGRRKVGVLAVDPSSPFSGGAILGDRIRMMRHSLDPGVFIRSMATRGQLGGLAKATGEAIAVLEAAGKDVILVETVGVGQDEVEVVRLADLVAVVLTPGAGDDIQAFKAGLMEIADIFVINKADAPGTEKLAQQLEALLELGFAGRPRPAIVKTIATKGDGVEELAAEVRRILRSRPPSDREARRKRRLAWMLRDILKERLLGLLAGRFPEAEFDRCVDGIYRRELDPYGAADWLLGGLRKAPPGRRRNRQA